MKRSWIGSIAKSTACGFWLILLSNCGSDANGQQSPATGGQRGQQAGGAPGQGGSMGGLAGSSGSATGGTSGGGGRSGSGGAPLNVPRILTTDGTSVLDDPRAEPTLGEGACTGMAVYCNGTCLSVENGAEGNCAVVKLGLGQTASVFLTEQALFYTAANQEILRMDLATGTHASLVRGLTFPHTLLVAGDQLYFGAEAVDGFFTHEVHRVGTTGGDVWILSPILTDPIRLMETIGDRLLLGEGNFPPYPLWTLPIAGGAREPFGGVEATYIVIDGDTLYYRGDMYLSSTSITAPAPDGFLNREFTNSRFLLDGGFLYHAYDDVYMRVPVTGGPMEEVQALEPDTSILGRTPTSVIFIRADVDNPDVTHLLTMPIAGGTPTELLRLETGEWQAMAANETHLYIAVGHSRIGAILRVDL